MRASASGAHAEHGLGCRAILRQPVPWLTLLAPDVVEAILDGRQPEEMRLEALLEGFALEWREQIEVFSAS